MSTAVALPHYHTERIDGREIQKPLPKNLHAFIQTFLAARLLMTLPRTYRAATELNVRCGNDRLVPDVAVMRRDARYEEGDLADSPALAVEILSPGQTIGDLLNKSDRLLRAGAGRCWVIWPERRQAWTYTSDALVQATDELNLTLPENESIKIKLQEVWAELD